MSCFSTKKKEVDGTFIRINDEPFYAIYNVDQMLPFFMSLVSSSDHWLFVSSTGGLTAGRVSPETALFPYVPVDKIHESALYTGSRTFIRLANEDGPQLWEPFNQEQDSRFNIGRHLYKNSLGNKLCFEEFNYDLQLAFRYTWSFSEEFGFVRECQLINLNEAFVSLDILDGLQNILPAGTPRYTQTQSSNLVDAYKWNELDSDTGLGLFTLYSGITDRAEPSESLRANTVFCLGLNDTVNLLSSQQTTAFRQGNTINQEALTRGTRGAYLVSTRLDIQGNSHVEWMMVANIEQSQAQVVALNTQLSEQNTLVDVIKDSVSKGSDELARIIGSSDGFQRTSEKVVTVHHYANTLFNVLRGGIFDDQYQIAKIDFCKTLSIFNKNVHSRHTESLENLPDSLDLSELHTFVEKQNDPQLTRLASEYLPITFGRRHGDPSRPWNLFELRFKDDQGNRLLSYQGNWRDIFQNWEALLFSYPDYIEQVIAKFVNASTVDGYNPYRITKKGIDWEVEEPDDPWSYIGYWGDHQVIYLLKLLELSDKFHPGHLQQLLSLDIFSYANVPYRIKPFNDLLKDPKNTVLFDDALASDIDSRVVKLGNDGKLLLNENGDVYQVNLLEKLLVTLLSKMSNFVLGGGIWLNTQRPEWNDANNALVGQGLSMVTLYYMRRYVVFLSKILISSESTFTELSAHVAEWLKKTATIVSESKEQLSSLSKNEVAHRLFINLGKAACNYRSIVYETGLSERVTIELIAVQQLLSNIMILIDNSIQSNQTNDAIFHAYNLLNVNKDSLAVSHLYPMLEGQVAAISSGVLAPIDTVQVLDALFKSPVFRPDQNTFMLYPDRELPRFLDKNKVSSYLIETNSLLLTMVKLNDYRLIICDGNGQYRFNPNLKNKALLLEHISELSDEYGDITDSTIEHIVDGYEQVFNHRAFTGRSGGMFGFEGLGCIYWHMVAKLLLAIQEQFFIASQMNASAHTLQRLASHYYAVREGLGFNKTPEEYGAFPCDPYSHTPKHAGAQQPGMTGQVKEEVLTRFGELGILVNDGIVTFEPRLLRVQEFIDCASTFKFIDVNGQWQNVNIPGDGLAFTWCQVPVIYHLSSRENVHLSVELSDGKCVPISNSSLPKDLSEQLFGRTGCITQINAEIPKSLLFKEVRGS